MIDKYEYRIREVVCNTTHYFHPEFKYKSNKWIKLSGSVRTYDEALLVINREKIYYNTDWTKKEIIHNIL